MMMVISTCLLLNVFRHTCGVLGETFGIDHAIEEIRSDSQSERDVLTVAQHSDIKNNVAAWKITHFYM